MLNIFLLEVVIGWKGASGLPWRLVLTAGQPEVGENRRRGQDRVLFPPWGQGM
jgi:hypothetical protein